MGKRRGDTDVADIGALVSINWLMKAFPARTAEAKEMMERSQGHRPHLTFIRASLWGGDGGVGGNEGQNSEVRPKKILFQENYCFLLSVSFEQLVTPAICWTCSTRAIQYRQARHFILAEVALSPRR